MARLIGLGTVLKKTVAQAERAGFLNRVKESEAERERSDLAGIGHSVFSKYLFRALLRVVVQRRYFPFSNSSGERARDIFFENLSAAERAWFLNGVLRSPDFHRDDEGRSEGERGEDIRERARRASERHRFLSCINSFKNYRL